jgi:hypothetical protein
MLSPNSQATAEPEVRQTVNPYGGSQWPVRLAQPGHPHHTVFYYARHRYSHGYGGGDESMRLSSIQEHDYGCDARAGNRMRLISHSTIP